jgi:hypothetical protein
VGPSVSERPEAAGLATRKWGGSKKRKPAVRQISEDAESSSDENPDENSDSDWETEEEVFEDDDLETLGLLVAFYELNDLYRGSF